MKSQTFKVLVVEDEVLLLKNIAKKIISISSDFCIVGEAFNGTEALELIETTHPDIVFTDIRMPIMDGLELCRILYEKHPEITTIIVSGYDDFEYARSVMHYGVCDYLLKPVQTETLRKLLFSLQEKLLRSKEEEYHTLLSRQLEGLPVSSDTLCLNELEHASFSMFLICFGNLYLRCKSDALNAHSQDIFNKFSWHTIWENPSFTYSDFYVFPHTSPNMQIVLVKDASASTEKIADFLHTELKQCLPDIVVSLAHKNKESAYPQLCSDLSELRRLLTSSFIIGQSKIFTNQEDNTPMPPAVLSLKDINYLQTIITANNTAEFQNVITNYFSLWETNNYTQQWVEKSLLHILTILQQNLFFSEEEYEQMYQTVFFILETEPVLGKAAEKILTELTRWLDTGNSMSSEIEDTIEEVYTFIISHYTEAINLADLAEKYHFNHSYLTRNFKKQIGESPLKLINTLRINDAKKLLMTTDLSVKEISEMLGFSNQHYFSRIFKEFTEQTPKEYRNR